VPKKQYRNKDKDSASPLNVSPAFFAVSLKNLFEFSTILIFLNDFKKREKPIKLIKKKLKN
jgi:hypothetical protein